jgi:formylglycine-generating enzyme required for sulfatase activity
MNKNKFFILIFTALTCFCARDLSRYHNQYSLHVSQTGNGKVFVSYTDTIVDAGTEITFIAVPDSGNIFLGWYGTSESTLDTFVVFAAQDMNMQAVFEASPNASGMKLISSRNKTFTMGSDGTEAETWEKPAHSVKLTYNYYMDKYEVTQQAYMNLIGVNPAAKHSAVSVNGDRPVYFVSWYDAALYCNARSKAEGYDTVYSYTAVCTDSQDCPYVLENLTVNYGKFGYRLPTEAEWEFACRSGTASDYFWSADYPDTSGSGENAWYSGNAGDSVHPVGQKNANAFGIFDMTGNVAEWVGDWLGSYPDTLAVDPVGPAGHSEKYFADSLLRPVRGGSYNLGTKYLRSSCRIGPYDTPAKTSDKAIGFRCVLGAFFPKTSSSTSSSIDTSGITVCNASTIINLTGTYSVKCAFVKQTSAGRILCYVDFSEEGRPVHILSDSLTPYNPVISPNGRYVTYGSRPEAGYAGVSRGTIRRLDSTGRITFRSDSSIKIFIPRWWVDKSSLDTFIIYTDNTVADDASEWKSSKTYRQQAVNGELSASAEILCDTGSFYGGLSYDGNFLATGFRNAYMLNLKSNDLFQYFSAGKNGTSNTIQVCNVTISPSYDNQDKVMFLDFGSSSTSSIVGKSYGLHSIIFTSNTNDSIGWYEKPDGYDRWEDAEWSNHPQFAVAVAQTDADADKGTIIGIDLVKHTYYTIAEGNGLRDPYLWIDPAQVSQVADPYHNFARYDVPAQLSGGQLPLCKKLKLFWNRFSGLDCAVVGGSPTYYGVDPSYITSVNALNIATISASAFTSYTIASNYVLVNMHSPQIIIMGLDPYSMTYNQQDPYLNGLPRTLGYQLDKSNNFWKGGLPDGVKTKIAAFDSSQWTGFHYNGATTDSTSRGWGDAQIDGTDYNFDDSAVQVNVQLFRILADTLAARGTHLLVVNFPENPLYKETDMIGRLGPSRTTYSRLAVWLKNLESQNSWFHFYDANMGGDHDYADSEALDCNHLNYKGARKLSRRLDSLCRIYLE